MTAAPERRWRRGFSTIGCPELDLAAVAALARRHGLADLELRALSGSTDLPAVLGGRLPEARSALAAQGCRIQLVATPVRLLDGPAGLAGLLAFAGLAEALDAPWLRVFDGGAPGVAPGDWSPAAALMDAWSAERSRRGWRCRVLVETHSAGATLEGIAGLRCAVPEAELLWDAYHTWHRGADAAAVWRACGDRVRHVHIKDSRAGSGEPFCPPGQGDVPLAGILDILDRGSFAGVVSLEWERLWHPGLPPLAVVLPAWA